MSQKRYSEIMAAAWQSADAFNAQTVVGLPIKLQTETGALVDMKTASEAFALPDGNVSIMLAIKTGTVNTYGLGRVVVEIPELPDWPRPS